MSLRSAIVRAIWGVLAAALAIAVVGNPARAADPEVEVVGTLDVSIKDATNPGPPNFNLILNPAMRRAYQFYRADNGTTMGRIYDLDARRMLLQKELPDVAADGPVAPSAAASEWIHAIDPFLGTIYLAIQETGSFQGVLALDPRTLQVLRFIERTPTNINPDTDDPLNNACTSSACVPQTPQGAPSLRGMSFVPSELTGLPPKLLLLSEDQRVVGSERNFNVVWLTQWDAQTGGQDYNYRVQSCGNSQLPSGGDYQVGVFQARLGSGVYIGCSANAGTGQVVRVNFDLNGQPSTEQAFPGPQGLADSIPDAESDRMIMRVSNEEGESLWVFDGGALAYTGVVGLTVSPAITANGIDPITGRFYTVAPPTTKGTLRSTGGMLMSDIRRSPAPQALVFPELAQDAIGAIRVDTHPTTGDRFVYVRPNEGSHYVIVEDNVPITEDPPLKDLDRLTIDVEEEEGVTGRNFTGTGHAFGLRALLVGGVHGFPPIGPDVLGIRVGRHGIQALGTPCGPGDRRLILGLVKDASLSNNTANASAMVGETDELTRADTGEPIGRCYPEPRELEGGGLWDSVIDRMRVRIPEEWAQVREMFTEMGLPDPAKYPRPLDKDEDGDDANGDGTPDGDGVNDYDELFGNASPFGTTQCSGDDGERSTDLRLRLFDRGEEEIPPKLQGRETLVPGAGAWVNCAQEKARIDSRSEMTLHAQDAPAFENTNVPGIGRISVEEVSAQSSIYLDPARGLVSRSEATVRGISIADDLFIDKAFTIAEAWAAGRSGTAATSFQRAVCGVRVSDQLRKTIVRRPTAEVEQENAGADPYVEAEPTPSPYATVEPNATVNPSATPSPRVEPQGGPKVDKNVFLAGCSDPVTHPQGQISVLDVVNRVLGARGRASAPEPDGELAQGTPGGYLASVQKDRLEKISSTAVNNDKADQVPALEIVIFNDDSTEGRGRQIYQLAGVDATVTYGLYLLNPEEFLDDPCLECGAPQPGVPFVPPAPPPTPPPPAGTVPPPHQGPIKILYQGVGFLLRNPLDMLLAAAVWSVLFAPVQLSWRRRALKGLR